MILAVFDIDNTIIDGQSQRLLISYLFRRGLFPLLPYVGLLFWFLRYRVGLAKKPEDAFRRALSCFQGKPSQIVEPILVDFVREVIAPRIYKGSTQKIKEHREHGDCV